MTGLETVLIGAGGVSMTFLGTFLGTARYYQKKLEDTVKQSVTKEQCKKCQQDQEKEGETLEGAIRAVGGKIDTLAQKHDRILKILILNIDLPNELKEQILP